MCPREVFNAFDDIELMNDITRNYSMNIMPRVSKFIHSISDKLKSKQVEKVVEENVQSQT
jgi:hypothetical protein